MVENMVENMKTWLRGNSTHGQISLHVVETGDTQEIHRRDMGDTWEIHGRYIGHKQYRHRTEDHIIGR
jgi:hypothetical protein